MVGDVFLTYTSAENKEPKDNNPMAGDPRYETESEKPKEGIVP